MAFPQSMVVEPEDVVSGLESWLESSQAGTPTLVYLAPGRWSGGTSGDDDTGLPPEPAHDDDAASGFRKALRHALKNGIKDRPVVVLTTIASPQQLDFSLRHQHGFDRRIKWPKVDDAVIGSLFLEETGKSLFDASVQSQPNLIGAVVRNECDSWRSRSLLQQALRRRAWREQCPLQLADLLDIAIWGTVEEDAKPQTDTEWRAHAAHEAGHAIVMWLTSRDADAPAYCSVSYRDRYFGVVVPSYESHESLANDMSCADAVHRIRALLAGRAAEYLLLGADRISAGGASQDLKEATRLAGSMFGKWGLSPDSTSPTAVASNLAVIVGEPTQTESAHVEGLVRSFLQDHFLHVLEFLKSHRALLERIVDALVRKGVLFQSDLEALAIEESAPGPKLVAVGGRP